MSDTVYDITGRKVFPLSAWGQDGELPEAQHPIVPLMSKAMLLAQTEEEKDAWQHAIQIVLAHHLGETRRVDDGKTYDALDMPISAHSLALAGATEHIHESWGTMTVMNLDGWVFLPHHDFTVKFVVHEKNSARWDITPPATTIRELKNAISQASKEFHAPDPAA